MKYFKIPFTIVTKHILNKVKMSILLKIIYVIPIKIPASFFLETGKQILRVSMEMQRTYTSQSIFEKQSWIYTTWSEYLSSYRNPDTGITA